MSILFLPRDKLFAHIVGPEATLRDAMQVLDVGGDLFALVVDPAGKLHGVLTDGDVRRALLRGQRLELPVMVAANVSPLTVRSTDRALVPRLLNARVSRARFLPEVDEQGHVVGVHLDREVLDGPVALVMAGGRGRRLGERTAGTPKPLIEVRGEPMIEHVVRGIEAADIRDVYVSAHYLADQIESWAANRDGTSRTLVIRETMPLGTAGAIGLLPTHVVGDVIVMNADVITGVDLARLLQFHRQLGTEATVAVATHEIEVPFGVVRADGEGRFLGIDEKPRLSHFVAAGIYILGAAARAFVDPGRPMDMPELLARIRAGGLPVGVFPIHERWRDLGRPVDLEAEDGFDGGTDRLIT